MTTHDLGTLLEKTGGKTCIINRSLETGNRTHCTVVGFESDNNVESAFCTEPIFGGIILSWARMNLVQCEKCGKFGHFVLECNTLDMFISKPSKTFKRVASDECHLQLAKLYKKKSVPISHLAAFGGKSWAQVVSLAGSSNGLHFVSGSRFSFSGLTGLNVGSSPVLADNLSLDAHLAFLERSLELLIDQVSGIVHKLSDIKLKDLVLDMVMDDSELVLSPLFLTSSSVLKLGLSSSKVLTTKKIAMCNVRNINVPAKQNNVVYWHKESSNMVSIVTKMKLKPSIKPWIMNKFEGVHIFTSGLDSGFLGAGVAIIMDNSLVQHVSKKEKVPDHIVLVCFLFKGRVLVSIIGLYACAFSGNQFKQAFCVNFFIARIVNSSSFVVLGGNFNKCSSKKSASYRFCLGLGLVNSFGGHSLAGAFTWSNLRGVEKVIDHILVSKSLISAVAGHKVGFVSEFFDINHKAVSVLVGLGGLLNVRLRVLCKQVNKDHWKFKLKGMNVNE
ncbi:hypothetical protein G9A89_013695 [Geosiphon pyriformis]|nr:hypothetical protein G9A89_013695 [Geosiphon pyriformis]